MHAQKYFILYFVYLDYVRVSCGVSTIKRVTQVDFVSQGVAELDSYKFSVPGSLHKLLSIAFGVGICFKWKLSPDSTFACEETIGKHSLGVLYTLVYCKYAS